MRTPKGEGHFSITGNAATHSKPGKSGKLRPARKTTECAKGGGRKEGWKAGARKTPGTGPENSGRSGSEARTFPIRDVQSLLCIINIGMQFGYTGMFVVS